MLRSSRQRAVAQRGVVLILALIVLAAMTLAAIGLMRSVTGTNRVAGNLAFQQSALLSADVGVQRAVAWLEQRARELDKDGSSANRLNANVLIGADSPIAYVATRSDPEPPAGWDSIWQKLADNGLVNSLPTDSAGNSVSFVIHRLCVDPGPSTTARCEIPFVPKGGFTRVVGASKGAPVPTGAIEPPDAVFYRITVRVQGPRNATGFVQAIVSF